MNNNNNNNNTHKKIGNLAVSFSFYFPHTTADMFLNITYLIDRPGQYRMTQKHSLHIRLAKWRLSDLRERLTNCSRGFRSVRLLVRRQSSTAASLSSSL